MPNYEVNYDDKRFTDVKSEEKEALSEVEETYGGMIADSDKYFQKQIDAVNDWKDKQTQLQQEQTDFAIEQIEQQKGQAKKDYIKEQSASYVDWQKQSNQYGVNAEQAAANGLLNSGYTESSQVSMYNTYQNRVATAREAFSRAVLNYDNAIKDAQLQNNSALAQIAYEALEKELTLSLQGFQYKNTLVLEMAKKKDETKDRYYQRYQDVLKQINTENALAEEIRQHNETMALSKEQFNWQKSQAAKSSGSSSGGSGSIKKSSGSSSSGSSKLASFSGTTYKEAVAYMEKNGGGDKASGLMTQGEWNRRKASYNSYGQGNSAVKNYNSYAEYLKDYVAYACDQETFTIDIIGMSDGIGGI